MPDPQAISRLDRKAGQGRLLPATNGLPLDKRHKQARTGLDDHGRCGD